MTTVCPGCFKGERRRLLQRMPEASVRTARRSRGSCRSPARPTTRRSSRSRPGRLSISGIQTKISLALKDGRMEMVESGGQYILKPIPQGGLQAAGSDADQRAPDHADRPSGVQDRRGRERPGSLRGRGARVPRPPVRRAGGRPRVAPGGLCPDRREVGGDPRGELQVRLLLRGDRGSDPPSTSPRYRVDLERYFTLVAFNYLVNNGDAHAKNFSLSRDDDGKEYNLTPAYDLLNTRLHLPDETRTALNCSRASSDGELQGQRLLRLRRLRRTRQKARPGRKSVQANPGDVHRERERSRGDDRWLRAHRRVEGPVQRPRQRSHPGDVALPDQDKVAVIN